MSSGQKNNAKEQRVQELKEYYRLEQHPEGGWFAECYTSEGTFAREPVTGQEQAAVPARAFSGSIYFLLDKGDISHFHRIDCEEVWYFHEGCGLKITTIDEAGNIEAIHLGSDISKGESVMAVIPKGVIFASQTLDPEGYCFVSCMTTPKFSYDGFKLISREELKELCPDAPEDVLALAYKMDC